MVLPFALPSLGTIISGISIGAIGTRIASAVSLGGIRSALFGSATRSAATGFTAGQFIGLGDVTEGSGIIKPALAVTVVLAVIIAVGQLFNINIG